MISAANAVGLEIIIHYDHHLGYVACNHWLYTVCMEKWSTAAKFLVMRTTSPGRKGGTTLSKITCPKKEPGIGGMTGSTNLISLLKPWKKGFSIDLLFAS